MGGIVTGDYIADVTHLVTDFASTRSPKFRVSKFLIHISLQNEKNIVKKI
jgi:hypothetical protein